MTNGMTFRGSDPYGQGYGDYFAMDESIREPILLKDGTSVLFPSHWTDEDVDRWRKGMGLQPPSAVERRGILH
jgi:hypothetical protein